jgi:hypothetical protein
MAAAVHLQRQQGHTHLLRSHGALLANVQTAPENTMNSNVKNL